MLKSAGEKAAHSATGFFLFVWAKVSNVTNEWPSEFYRSTAYAHDGMKVSNLMFTPGSAQAFSM